MNNYDPRIVVTLPSRDLRKIARDTLSGKWKIGALGTLIYCAIIYVPSAILGVMFPGGFANFLYELLIYGPFTFGYSVFMLNIFRNKKADYTQLFDGFEYVLKTIFLYLYIQFFVMLWMMLLVIPGIIASLRYSQAFFILADNPEISVPEAVNRSKLLMRQNILKLFCLEFSFIGWDILASIPSAIAGAILGANIVTTISSNGTLDFILEQATPEAAAAALFTTGQLFMLQMLSLLLSAGYLFLMPYKESAYIAMYEIMQDNLRPGKIMSSATVINPVPDIIEGPDAVSAVPSYSVAPDTNANCESASETVSEAVSCESGSPKASDETTVTSEFDGEEAGSEQNTETKE